jgi:hypothetical protein
VSNLPPQTVHPATTPELAAFEGLQVGCRLVAALATTMTRIVMRQMSVGGRYGNFFQNFPTERKEREKMCVGITIGTSCHTCHHCHPEPSARAWSSSPQRPARDPFWTGAHRCQQGE